MPAPDSPPINACELDDGSPSHHVNRFHRIAAIRPHITTYVYAGSIGWTWTMFAIVFATPVWKMNSATKLNVAAHSTAIRGDSTRVDTTVAIEFAASWKPLMMSKISATEMVTMTMVPTSISGVLEDHALDDVGDVLAAIGCVLEVLVDLFPLDHGDRVLLLLEQAGDRTPQDHVGLVLEPVDVHA